MRIKRDVDVQQAADEIQELIDAAARIPELVGDSDSSAYVLWVHDVERALRELFADIPTDRLYTEPFWRAQQPILSRKRLVTQELERQLDWLSDLRDTVRDRACFSAGERTIAVLDTNVVLHHRPLSEVDWASVVGAERVLLVVPVRVIEELDARKYAGTKLGDRARKRIKLLSDQVAAEANQVRPGVHVEIVESVDLDADAARRPPIPADAEILETCEALKAYAGSNPVCLVTADLGMRVVAEAREIAVRRMPDETMQPLGDESS